LVEIDLTVGNFKFCFKNLNMYLSIKAVKPQDNYFLLLTFENGEQRQFDMKPYLDISRVKGHKLI